MKTSVIAFFLFILGNLDFEMAGSLSTLLDSSGFSGELNANASGSCNLTVKWPSLAFWNNPVSDTYNVTVSGNVKVVKTTAVNVSGNLTLSSTNQSESFDFNAVL